MAAAAAAETGEQERECTNTNASVGTYRWIYIPFICILSAYNSQTFYTHAQNYIDRVVSPHGIQ